MKVCSKCGLLKPYSQFNKTKLRPDGYQGHCRICQNENSKKHYEANKQYYVDKASASTKRKFDWYRDLKSKPCTDCGVSYHPAIMEFDHIGTDKQANVSKMIIGCGRERILAEIAKCELVCSNCHRLRTLSRLGDSDGKGKM